MILCHFVDEKNCNPERLSDLTTDLQGISGRARIPYVNLSDSRAMCFCFVLVLLCFIASLKYSNFNVVSQICSIPRKRSFSNLASLSLSI